MASEEVQEDLKWFEVGDVGELQKRSCRRLYTKSRQDLALFCVKGTTRFFASTASCPHAQGPLDQGDIEDLGEGKVTVTCPLHYYSFDLQSGESSSDLTLKTYPTEIREGKVFVKAPEMVSTKFIKA